MSTYCGSLYKLLSLFVLSISLGSNQPTRQGKPVNDLMLICPNVKYFTDFMNLTGPKIKFENCCETISQKVKAIVRLLWQVSLKFIY